MSKNRIQELDDIVKQFDLNTHPFYQDWVMGKLPKEKLVDYSGEYARFVGTIASGWETIGENHYADEEREHEILWRDFKDEIGFKTISNRPQTQALVTAANTMFAGEATAAGALYAFEAQQPNTSKSKLDGLNAHYDISDKGKKYFEVHALDFNEVEDLKKHVANMTDAEFEQTKVACHLVCAAMWSALDGVYYN